MGASTSRGRFCQKFLKSCMKLKEFGPGGVPRTPLRSVTGYFMKYKIQLASLLNTTFNLLYSQRNKRRFQCQLKNLNKNIYVVLTTLCKGWADIAPVWTFLSGQCRGRGGIVLAFGVSYRVSKMSVLLTEICFRFNSVVQD